MGEAKQRRIAEAQMARERKRQLATNALAVAALRAASVYAVMLDEWEAQTSSRERFRDQRSRSHAAFEVNSASRAAAMVDLFYASLNVVVEGWLDPSQASPKLSDDRINTLLASDFVEALKKYRHALMHPNALDDSRAVTFTELHPAISEWAVELLNQFVRFFGDWRRANPLVQ